MKAELSEKEAEAFNEFKENCKKVFEYQGLTKVDTLEFYLEVHFTGIGTTVIAKCDFFKAKKDITDYSCW